MHGLLRLGGTQQRLLRQLLMSADGCTVEDICLRLKITHNALQDARETGVVLMNLLRESVGEQQQQAAGQ